MSSYPPRNFLLLLDDSEESLILKCVLKSPLGLASGLIDILFENDFLRIEESLDEIKLFAAGIASARKLADETNYKLASYYPSFFSFQQFFHSSYRARQGKVLEKILMRGIKEFTSFKNVPETPTEMANLLKNLNIKFSKLDIDVLAEDITSNKLTIIQIRSRDDTGGTTAKGSLVDVLKGILRANAELESKILYIVFVWDARDSQQKNSTITKCYSSLQELISSRIGEDEFKEKICKGINISDNIKLILAYGTKELLKILFDWSENKDDGLISSIDNMIMLIQNWDDLWISYLISNLELEIQAIHGKSNVSILDEKINIINSKFDFTSYDKLVESIDKMTTEIIPIWTEDSLPVDTPSDQATYIRDLLFLRAIYEKK